MSAPSHDDDQLKLEIFDSFSKTVMRNASRNFAAAAKTCNSPYQNGILFSPKEVFVTYIL